MADYTYSNNNIFLEELFVTWDEIGVIAPFYTTGNLLGWGRNVNSELGLGDNITYSSPAAIGSNTGWRYVASGTDFSAGIRIDGTLWAWGSNQSGQLGLNSVVSRSRPAIVGTAVNWKQVATGTSFAAGIQETGTLWAWGNATSGALGLSSITQHRSAPTQLGTDTWWQEVAVGTDGTTNTNFCAAIRSDGTLWTWGNNAYGQLGLNDVALRSSPTQMGFDNNWKFVAAGARSIVAIKNNGTMWYTGAAGLATTVSSPVQIGTSRAWKYVSIGKHALALKNDNTLWTWGDNLYGQLGLNDNGAAAHRSSPVQIGSSRDWKLVAANGITDNYYSVGLRTDGTLWVWGDNTYGQLGLDQWGVGVHRSSPIQLGTSNTWKFVGNSRDSNTLGVWVNPTPPPPSFGGEIIEYTLGVGGAGGVSIGNGINGTTTTVQFLNYIISGSGGRGGQNFTTVASWAISNSAGGTFSISAGTSNSGGAVGGQGQGRGNNQGGGGGGGLGAALGITVTSNLFGGQGGVANDVSGLATVVNNAGGYTYATSSGSAGHGGYTAFNDVHGGNASGVGSGGGGAGHYGGNGGNGYLGGGGGGAAGETASRNGGNGGNGFVAIQLTANNVTQYIVLTSGTSYILPPNTTTVKIWAVGAGGGGGGAYPVSESAGAGGGAGGVAYMMLTT